MSLRLRLHSHGPDGEQSVHLLWNEESLETIRVPVKWKDFAIPLPEGRLRPARNRLALVFSRQSSPAEHGKSSDRRPLACELASLSVIDARGREVYSLDPAHQRFSLGRGFYLPRGSLTEVQSVHWRAKPVWSLLGELGHPVGIVGYWGTWPAYEVNGFLVSSRMGIREQRQASDRLTWPPELATELVSLAPHARDLEETFARLHVADCQPPLLNEKPALRKILLQDEFYFRIARRLLPSMDRGFFSVYFRSIDVASHVSLHWRHGAQLGVGCSESVREIVDEIYVQIDRWIGDLVEMLSNRATIVLVSDHGMKSIDFAGHHAPYGIFLSAGRGVRKGSAVEGASLLDVAPTILHIFGAPIPSDMDGHVLAQIFDTQWMESHPPRYVDMDTSLTSKEEALAEGTEEVLEELRAIGYIQ
ncbi:MAG: alkaline phosphatase family protein [Acidobacteriota bacterium]